MRWLKYLSFMYYGFRLILKVQYSGDQLYECQSQGGCRTLQSSPSFDTVNLNGGLKEVWILLAMAIGYRLCAYFCLRRRINVCNLWMHVSFHVSISKEKKNIAMTSEISSNWLYVCNMILTFQSLGWVYALKLNMHARETNLILVSLNYFFSTPTGRGVSSSLLLQHYCLFKFATLKLKTKEEKWKMT